MFNLPSMPSLVLSSLLFTLASAIWPKPLSYDHGDTVLFIQKDIPFYWHEAVANNAGSIVEEHLTERPMMLESEHNLDSQEYGPLKPRKRYTQPSFEELGDHSSEKGVSSDDMIDYAIKSTWKTIFQQTPYFSWKFHPRGWAEPSPSPSPSLVTSVHIILLTSDDSKPLADADSTDESYILTLTTHGVATISANTSIGIARGLTTFTQLFYAHSSGTHFYTPLAPVRIFDAPAFPHRGLNLDVARNWFPVVDIKRQIDTLAYNKLNVFHLHITDSQSWPLVIPSLPHLAEKGAYAPDLVYSPADFAELQRHAALQGVQLITEIDMPGHTSAIWFSYPDLIAAFNKQPWEHWAAEPPSGTLKLNSTAVYEFLEKLFDDVLPRVKPYSGYWHTGGDEVNKNAYTLDDTVRSSEPAILQPLMQTFIDFTHDRVRAARLTPIVWEEMLLEWNLTLGSDVIVQSWRSDDAVKRIVESGHKALVGNYKYWVRPLFPTHLVLLLS